MTRKMVRIRRMVSDSTTGFHHRNALDWFTSSEVAW